tara:strand:+ start:571 stop:1191 length:621 start_codon:yes stop_codon:yes gene_type:complete
MTTEKEYQKEYELKNKEKIKNRKKIFYMEKGGKEKQKEYQLNNKEKIKEQRKIYYLKNKEKLKEQGKENYLNNKESKLKYQREYGKKYFQKNKQKIYARELNRSKTIPSFRMRKSLKSRIYSALKGNNKSASTMKLIGCSIDKLWNHLESKFESWMTKENYGLWHVDHIKPCAKFDLTCEEQQRICFHYTNLQPLEAIENMRKGCK